MAGQPLDRFRFLDGFLKQSPRLLGSIRTKGYRFFPGLEAEGDELRREWSGRREALRQAAQDSGDVEELHQFEAAAAPLMRMLERLRKLYVGLASAPFAMGAGEEPIWYDDTEVVAKTQRIPVALFITTERLLIVRSAEGGARNVRDYKLAAFKGIAALPTPEGAVLAFGNDRLALGTGNAESWRRLLAKLTSPEFRSDLTPAPDSAADDEGARTAILTPELVAKAMAAKPSPAPAPREPRPTPPPEPIEEPVLLVGEPESEPEPEPTVAIPHVEETRKMTRPPAAPKPAVAPQPMADADALLLDVEPLPERAEPAEDDRPVSSVSMEELLGGEPSPPPPAPEPPAPAAPPEKGPGGHEVISFDTIFQDAGVQADDAPAAPSRPAPPPSPAPEPAPPPPPPQAAEPPPREAPPPPSADPPRTAGAGVNIALKGLATKEAMRSGTAGARYVMKGGEAPVPRAAAAAPAPSKAERETPGGRSKLLVLGIVAAVIIVMFLALVLGVGRRKTPSPIDVGGVEEGRAPIATGPTPTKTPAPTSSPTPSPEAKAGGEEGLLRVVEEEIVGTPAGSLTKQTGPLPKPAAAKVEAIPPYDPSVKEYRIHLKNGGEMKVERYAILSTGIAVPFEDGYVEIPFAKVVRVEPLP